MMDVLMSIIMLCLPSIVASFIATVIAYKVGVTDVSNARSSHNGAVRTAGGVSIIAAFIAMMFVPYFRGENGAMSPQYLGLIGLTTAIAGLGLYDDIRGARSLPKLLFMTIAAVIASVLIGPIETVSLPIIGAISLPPFVGIALSVLWIVVVVNAVNFIDGANGMMVSTISMAAMGLIMLSQGWANNTFYWALALLIGLLCFSPFNFRKTAAMFAGDVGALTAGFIFAIAGLFLVRNSPQADALFVLPLLILPILVDVFMTLIRRARAGENILQAHNQHLFQRQIQAGASHIRVSLSYMFASAMSVLYALSWYFAEMHYGSRLHLLWALMAGVLIGVAIYIPLYRRAMAKIATNKTAG